MIFCRAPGVTTYRVSELAERVGLPPSTLRFYEQAGLVPARRSESGYRLFDDQAVERIEVITTGKRLGLPLEEISDLLQVWENGLCHDVRERLRPMVANQIINAERRAAEIDAFIERLRRASSVIDGLAPPGRCGPGCGIVLPIAVAGFFGTLLALRRIPVAARALAAPGQASRLEYPHLFRVEGVAFLIIMALGHLPALFALPAGLGDIAAGIAAPLVAYRLARGTGHRAARWHNAFGMTDLAVALTLGALTGFRRPAGSVLDLPFQGRLLPLKQRVSEWQALSVAEREIPRDASYVHDAHIAEYLPAPTGIDCPVVCTQIRLLWRAAGR